MTSRRQFVTLLGGAAAAWPMAGRAQSQSAIPVIGFLSSASADQWMSFIAAFLRGLREIGFVEGKNVAIEYRWAEGRYDRLPAFAADLVRNRSDVIVAVTPPAALAAKATGSAIPIVFVTGVDPVALGLVASFNRPGGNLTGFNFITAELASKILQTILALLPRLSSIAILVNPDNPNSMAQARDAQAAAAELRLKAHVLYANSEATINSAFSELKERSVNALIIGTDSFFLIRKNQLVSLSHRFGVPTVYNLREYVTSGGLLSYGTSLTDAYRQIGMYVGRILKGEKPADLPVLQPTKFELIINLKTAKAFGLDVPATLLALADEMIE